MRKTNIIIISLCLSVFILTSVVHADLLIPGSSSKDTRASIKDTNSSSKDTGASTKNELNSLLVISAVIIGIIALIAWLVIRKIKK